MKMDPLFSVENEIVVITGAAGQLGHQYSKAFLARGAQVIGLDIQSSIQNENLIQATPEGYQFFKTDICNKLALQEVLQEITYKVGTPSVLINNAGIDASPSSSAQENGPFEDYPEEAWDKVMDVNLKAVYLCCQVFGSAMAEKNTGSIINISSIYGNVAPDQNLYDYRRKRGENFYKPITYSVSKAGILNLTRYLATYWAKKGVRVNTLTIAGVFNHQEDEFLNAYCKRIPIGRMANENEYNGAVLFLASAATKYMTGSNLIIDGGWTAI